MDRMDQNSRIEEHFRLLEPQKRGLKRLGLHTIKDLLFYFPNRHSEAGEVKNISNLVRGETASIYGKVTGLELKKGFRSKIPMARGQIQDATGTLQTVWFHQPYIAKMLPEGAYARFTGKISESKKGFLYLSNPEFEVTDEQPKVAGSSLFGESHEDGALMPIYSETQGITSKWIYHAIQKIFASGILKILLMKFRKKFLRDIIYQDSKHRLFGFMLREKLMMLKQPGNVLHSKRFLLFNSANNTTGCRMKRSRHFLLKKVKI
jgi:RecG-like helicase